MELYDDFNGSYNSNNSEYTDLNMKGSYNYG